MSARLSSKFAVWSTFALASMLLAAGCSDRSSPAAPPTNQSMARTSIAEPHAASANGSDQTTAEAKHSASSNSDPQAVRDINFDTIKFNIQKEQPFERSMLTPAIEKLQNMPVRIRGFILPSFQQTGLTQFVLVRDNMECCFGPGAALYDCIVVEMTPGKSTDFTTHPVAVEGVFTIHELRSPDDRCMAVYRLDADKVR
jgi:hypothetical protein